MRSAQRACRSAPPISAAQRRTFSELHRTALKKPEPATVITNVLTGRPARAILNRFIAEQGPLNAETPAFRLATQAAIPLRTNADKQGSGDFSSFWSGEARALGPT
jgi:nitronate monooxygenase